ncbi:MAG: hypothetical protein RLZZ241_2302 [Bacteroidota bacterium]|jgi:threonine dehydrogenase-like Zn-dependent dehydrogenase
MTQSFLVKPSELILKSGPMPQPQKGEALIRMERAGICGSDLHLFHKGHGLAHPITLGHEAVGIVEKLGLGVLPSLLGKRVVVEPNIPCENCLECTNGMGHVCRNKRIIGVNENGCFTDYAAIPALYLHSIPDGISENDAVTIEPAAVAYSALRRSELPAHSTIAVIGLGAIGMLVCHIGLALGYRVFAFDPIENKLEKAKKLGAHPIPKDTPVNIENFLTACGVVGVFECAGASKTATFSIEVAPRGAKIVLLGLSEDPAQFIPRVLARKGNTIMPSLIYDHPTDFQQTIELINIGVIQPGFIVEADFALNELITAFEHAQAGQAIKVTLNFSNHD